MTDFLQNLGTIGCLGAEREAFATQLSATHTTRKSHVFAGTVKPVKVNTVNREHLSIVNAFLGTRPAHRLMYRGEAVNREHLSIVNSEHFLMHQGPKATCEL